MVGLLKYFYRLYKLFKALAFSIVIQFCIKYNLSYNFEKAAVVVIK